MKLLLMVMLFSSTLSAEEFVIAYGPVKPSPVVEAAEAEKAFLRSTVRFKRSHWRGGVTVEGHGTAFAVDLAAFGYVGKQYLLTAYHNVVDDETATPALRIELNKKWVDCKVVAFNQRLDICLLESAVALSDVIAMDSAELSLGEFLILGGSPRGVPIKSFTGVLHEQFTGGSYRMLAKIEFDHGDSGGPVVNQKTYKLVGMAVSGVPKDGDLDTKLMMYMPLSVIASFLKDIRKP